MCLSKVITAYDKDRAPKRERWAYKVFEVVETRKGPRLDFPYYPVGRGYATVGKWLKARQITPSPSTYRLGFHAFTTAKNAAAYVRLHDIGLVIKVRIRGIRAIGEQSGLLTLVAAEMMIPENTKVPHLGEY